MFMALAISAIGIAIVIMVGYLIVAQVRVALPTITKTYTNACYGYYLNDTTNCNTTSVDCGPLTDNTSATVSCTDTVTEGSIDSAQVTVFAGFALVAVGIIVLAAFGLINIFN